MSDAGITGSFDELAALEKRLARLTGESLTKAGAKAIAAVARRQYKAGTGPDGKPWPLKKDGSKPLQNAAEEVTFTPEGTTIRGRAPLHYVFHARTCPVFPPEGAPLPDPWMLAFEGAVRKEVEGK